MAERTPAQRAATARLIRWNRAHRGGRSARRESRHHETERRSPRGTSYGLVEVGGAAAIGFGLIGPKNDWGPVRYAFQALKGQGATLREIPTAIKEGLPIVGTDPAKAGNRAMIVGGAAAIAAGHIARKVPIVKKLRSLKLKLDRKTTLRAI